MSFNSTSLEEEKKKLSEMFEAKGKTFIFFYIAGSEFLVFACLSKVVETPGLDLAQKSFSPLETLSKTYLFPFFDFWQG